MVRLVYDTGIRLGEIPTIERMSTELQKGLLVVYGKGRKERWVPFGKKTTAALWKYIKARDRISEARALFVTHGGRDLAYGGVNVAFRRMGLKPHTIRHSFATTSTLKAQHVRHSPGDRIQRPPHAGGVSRLRGMLGPRRFLFQCGSLILSIVVVTDAFYRSQTFSARKGLRNG